MHLWRQAAQRLRETSTQYSVLGNKELYLFGAQAPASPTNHRAPNFLSTSIYSTPDGPQCKLPPQTPLHRPSPYFPAPSTRLPANFPGTHIYNTLRQIPYLLLRFPRPAAIRPMTDTLILTDGTQIGHHRTYSLKNEGSIEGRDDWGKGCETPG